MNWQLATILCAAGTAGIAVAQRGELPAECRQEIFQQCRRAEEGIRACAMSAFPKFSDSCRRAIGARNGDPVPGASEYSYGPDPKQRLDLVRPAGDDRLPVLLFVHGGGWSIGDKRQAAGAKAEFFTSRGWAFGSVNYRLVPKASVEQQASDLAAAVAWVQANAAANGLDPDRIVLMGHSAGAHLAALVGTDPAYLSAAGVRMESLRGIVLLDGAGYDVARQMAAPHNPVLPMFEAAFGRDPRRQNALSPSFHAEAPNVAQWLVLPVARRQDSVAQSIRLAAALEAAGSHARVVEIPSATHRSLNRGFGQGGDLATRQVERFLERLR